MLEKDVRQLDVDYMILYSKYILSKTLSFGRLYEGSIDNDVLVELIKLGQLNALQLYGKELYNNKGLVKENIDVNRILNILKSKPNKNYNELYALSCYLLDSESEIMYDQYIIHIDNDKKFGRNKLKELKENINGYKYMKEAIEKANEINNENYNLLLECFIYDMLLSSRYISELEYRVRLHGEGKWCKEEYDKEVNKYVIAKEKLKEELKIDPTNEVLAFTLARSIVTLFNLGKANIQEYKKAQAIFSKFAEKKYTNITKNKSI